MCDGQSYLVQNSALNELLRVGVRTAPESWKIHFLEGESPSTGVLIQPVKINLGHHREAVSKGDAEYRETHSRIGRPKCKSVKHGGRVS